MIKPVALHLITGKGGVGKSAVAAALALSLAREGHKTLLVELGEDSFYQSYFSLPEVRFQPSAALGSLFKPAAPLYLALWSGSQCLLDYALYLLKFESLVKLFFENPISRALINVAPGLEELAILGKATSGPPRNVGPKLGFDRIVVDGFSTGHFLTLIRSPQALGEAIRFGPMGEQSRSIFASLCNPAITQFHVVSLLESLPTKESLELVSELKKLTGQDCNIVLNRFEILPKFSEMAQGNGFFVADLKRRADEQEASLRVLSEVLNQQESQQAKNHGKMICLPKSFALEEVDLIEELCAKILAHGQVGGIK
jgi:anion-transporting  ArsA/GET3 family ATPase